MVRTGAMSRQHGVNELTRLSLRWRDEAGFREGSLGCGGSVIALMRTAASHLRQQRFELVVGNSALRGCKGVCDGNARSPLPGLGEASPDVAKLSIDVAAAVSRRPS